MANQKKIGFSIFDRQTRQTFLDSTKHFLGHNKKINCLKQGDIVLLYDMDTKEVFGICTLRALDSEGCIYHETHPYDKELYSDAYQKFNKYEVGVKTLLIPPTLSNTIMVASGLPENTALVGRPQSFCVIKQNIWPWIQETITCAWQEGQL